MAMTQNSLVPRDWYPAQPQGPSRASQETIAKVLSAALQPPVTELQVPCIAGGRMVLDIDGLFSNVFGALHGFTWFAWFDMVLRYCIVVKWSLLRNRLQFLSILGFLSAFFQARCDSSTEVHWPSSESSQLQGAMETDAEAALHSDTSDGGPE